MRDVIVKAASILVEGLCKLGRDLKIKNHFSWSDSMLQKNCSGFAMPDP